MLKDSQDSEALRSAFNCIMWIFVRHCRHLKNHKVTKHGDMILIVLYVDIGKKTADT